MNHCSICKISGCDLIKSFDNLLCNNCQTRVQNFVDSNINNSVFIPWDAGNISHDVLSKIQTLHRKHGIHEILEYNLGLSTELFIVEGFKVTSLDFSKYYADLYRERTSHDIIWCAEKLPDLDRIWDIVYVYACNHTDRILHATKYANRFLVTCEQGADADMLLEENKNWEQVEENVWERKTSSFTGDFDKAIIYPIRETKSVGQIENWTFQEFEDKGFTYPTPVLPLSEGTTESCCTLVKHEEEVMTEPYCQEENPFRNLTEWREKEIDAIRGIFPEIFKETTCCQETGGITRESVKDALNILSNQPDEPILLSRHDVEKCREESAQEPIEVQCNELWKQPEESKSIKKDGYSRFAYIVSACSKYIPELCACLNSLDYVGNEEDVYVLGYNLPHSFTSQFDKLRYKVNFYDIPEAEARQYGGESEILCRKRYWYAAQYGQNHDVMCVLDADMVFCRNPWQYFEIAAKTNFICGAGLEQKRLYGHIEHHKVRGKHLLPKPVWAAKDICCAPMFVNMKKYGDLFRECWTIFADGFPVDNFKAPDMESYNLLILAKGLQDQVLLLPNYQWVGTNEKLLKCYTRVVTQSDGCLWTESGLEIYIIHGQFYKQRWRQVQLENRHNCAEGYLGCSEKSDGIARGAMNCLWEKFKQMLNWKIKVDDKKAYVERNGEPGDTLV